MIDITEPARPLNSLLPYVALDLVGDRRAAYTGIQDDGKSLEFEYLVGPVDWTTDLAYFGTDALNLGRNNLTDAFDSTDLSGVMLPVPGNPHSLSYNKDIMLSDTAAFVTTWRTDEDSDTITLPINGSGMTVVWGDGHVDRGISAPVNHTYTTAGNYTVQVTGGLTVFNLNGHNDAPKIISIDQWGDASWTTMKDAFQGASRMSYHATDAPDLSGVADMSSMFYGAASVNGDISSWNVSSVNNMVNMFKRHLLIRAEPRGVVYSPGRHLHCRSGRTGSGGINLARKTAFLRTTTRRTASGQAATLNCLRSSTTTS